MRHDNNDSNSDFTDIDTADLCAKVANPGPTLSGSQPALSYTDPSGMTPFLPVRRQSQPRSGESANGRYKYCYTLLRPITRISARKTSPEKHCLLATSTLPEEKLNLIND